MSHNACRSSKCNVTLRLVKLAICFDTRHQPLVLNVYRRAFCSV